ncbi:methionyl-tRNA formyltransferase [Ruegeria faecimaris]|uniref:methionyl-tRNA formyltransferase n=1 Tax=Ruegeria faecimaris TaxID=686389 RepID=UPI0024933727|nr:formyltransferase family protein [Ruegeria faecimaris]
MKTVFVGAVEGSHVALSAICARGFVPDLVVTLPPDLSHRHSDFADLKPTADRYDIPVHYTAKSDSAGTIKTIQAVKPDLILVIGWSQICGPEFRAQAKIGCVGFHPSALPRLRGRGVIPWTVILGETDVGASLFWLGEGADDGPIAAQARYAVDPDTVTARELYDRALQALTQLLPQLLTQISEGDIPAAPQPETGISLCARRRPEDGLIDWTRPAAEINRLIRAAGPPYPGAFTYTASGEKLVLLGVQNTALQGYYIGLPGQIQAIEGNRFTVACGDGKCLDITNWTGADAPPELHSKLRNSE